MLVEAGGEAGRTNGGSGPPFAATEYDYFFVAGEEEVEVVLEKLATDVGLAFGWVCVLGRSTSTVVGEVGVGVVVEARGVEEAREKRTGLSEPRFVLEVFVVARGLPDNEYALRLTGDKVCSGGEPRVRSRLVEWTQGTSFIL